MSKNISDYNTLLFFNDDALTFMIVSKSDGDVYEVLIHKSDLKSDMISLDKLKNVIEFKQIYQNYTIDVVPNDTDKFSLMMNIIYRDEYIEWTEKIIFYNKKFGIYQKFAKYYYGIVSWFFKLIDSLYFNAITFLSDKKNITIILLIFLVYFSFTQNISHKKNDILEQNNQFEEINDKINSKLEILNNNILQLDNFVKNYGANIQNSGFKKIYDETNSKLETLNNNILQLDNVIKNHDTKTQNDKLKKIYDETNTGLFNLNNNILDFKKVCDKTKSEILELDDTLLNFEINVFGHKSKNYENIIDMKTATTTKTRTKIGDNIFNTFNFFTESIYGIIITFVLLITFCKIFSMLKQCTPINNVISLL